MKYIRSIGLLSSFFELYIILFMIKDELDKTYLYLINDKLLNFHLLLIMIAIIVIRLIFSSLAFHKLKWQYFFISSILSVTMSSIWIIMFFNTIFHDHFRTLTPLLLYLASIKIILSWYFADFGKGLRYE